MGSKCSGLLNKSIISSHYKFIYWVIANLKSGLIRDNLPQSNSDNNPILFYICSGNTQPASLFFMKYPKLRGGKKTLLPLVLIQMKLSSNHHGF
jgi:hypothetical protein